MRRLASLRAIAAGLCLVLHTGGSSQPSHHRARCHAFLSASAPAGSRLPPPSTSHSLAETAVNRPGPCSRASGRHGRSLGQGQEGRHFGGVQPLQGVGDDWVRQVRTERSETLLMPSPAEPLAPSHATKGLPSQSWPLVTQSLVIVWWVWARRGVSSRSRP
jgi:hypothetical protein